MQPMFTTSLPGSITVITCLIIFVVLEPSQCRQITCEKDRDCGSSSLYCDVTFKTCRDCADFCDPIRVDGRPAAQEECLKSCPDWQKSEEGGSTSPTVGIKLIPITMTTTASTSTTGTEDHSSDAAIISVFLVVLGVLCAVIIVVIVLAIIYCNIGRITRWWKDRHLHLPTEETGESNTNNGTVEETHEDLERHCQGERYGQVRQMNKYRDVPTTTV